MDEPLLRTDQLTKRYGAITVLDRVTLDVRGGEIHGLLGANGAGKSTFCKIVAGLTTASSGTMFVQGQPYEPADKQAAERRGVGIVQQELNLIPTLTVAENLLLTRLPSRGGIIRRGELQSRARRILDRFGLPDVAPEAPAAALGVGRQQMVEIASALSRDCRLLILDEPTSALSGAEVDRLFQWLDRLRDQGVGVVYISHRLGEVARVTDRVSVLRDGRHVGTRATHDVSTDDMVGLMSGSAAPTPSGGSRIGTVQPEVALSVEGVTRGPVRDVSFTVRRGERFGIAGLVGSGRTELLRAVFGADVATAGQVTVGRGAPRRFRSPHQAVDAGLAMVTEDRKQNGLLLSQSVRVNVSLPSLSSLFSKRGVLRSRRERESTAAQCAALETQCTSIEQIVAALSGGNQQKVAVAKWLLRDAEVFLFDEPTRGIDLAARGRIHRLFESLAAQGKGLVIVSSDLAELFESCDRIGVMSAGRLAAIFDRSDWSEERIMQAAFHYR